MSTQDYLLHEWHLKEDSWFLKFYYFWYPFTDEDVTPNFCKMVWATVFAIPMIVGWIGIGLFAVLIAPFVWIVDRRKASKYDRATRSDMREKARKVRKAARKEQAAAIPTFFAKWTDRAVAWYQAHVRALKILGIGLLSILALVVAGFIYWGAEWIVVTLYHNWVWSTFWWVMLGIVAVVAFLAIIGGLSVALGKTGWGSKMGDGFYDHILTPFGHVGRDTGLGIWGVVKFIGMFFHHVKARTCPRIVIDRK